VAKAEAAESDPPPESAGARYRQALEIFRVIEPKVRKDNPEIRFERAAILADHGDYLRAVGKPVEAIDVYRDVFALLGDGDWYPNPRPHHRMHQATSLRRWGGVLLELGEANRAAEQLSQAVDLFGDLIAQGPEAVDPAPFRLEALAERALARWAAGRPDAARADAEEVVRKPVSENRTRLARAKGLWVLGESARLKTDYAKAREHLNEVLAGDPPKAAGTEAREWKHVRALASLSLGDVARAGSDHAAAARHYRAARELLTQVTDGHPELPRYRQARDLVDKRVAEVAE
jgi:tetratricopeptide (TPR) repeat protein